MNRWIAIVAACALLLASVADAQACGRRGGHHRERGRRHQQLHESSSCTQQASECGHVTVLSSGTGYLLHYPKPTPPPQPGVTDFIPPPQ
jgi:hypothetical protein